MEGTGQDFGVLQGVGIMFVGVGSLSLWTGLDHLGRGGTGALQIYTFWAFVVLETFEI